MVIGHKSSGAKKAHKHKERYRTSPVLDPTLKFFMWGPPFLENEGEGTTHIKNLGLHWGPLHSLCGYFFMCFFFRFLQTALSAGALAIEVSVIGCNRCSLVVL